MIVLEKYKGFKSFIHLNITLYNYLFISGGDDGLCRVNIFFL